MRNVAQTFLILSVLSALVGMLWGILMSIAGDHAMAPAHAHLNLTGFVAFAVFAFYYRLVPEAAESGLARLHLLVALVGLIAFVPGIIYAILERGETLVAAGSLLTVLSMLIFAVVVLRYGFAEQGRGA